MATKKATKRVSGPSGAHKQPRKILSASEEQWGKWQQAADRARRNLSDWMRISLDDAAARK